MAITYLASRGYKNKSQGNSVLNKPVGATYLPSTYIQKEEDEREQNVGGPIGGLGYLGEKLMVGVVSSLEGITDYAFSGLAKLFRNDAWAEELLRDDWFGDWYSHPEEWFNPDQGWQVAGDVAGGVGTSIPGLAAAVGLTIATGGTALPAAAKLGIVGLGSGLASGLGAAGNATKEAYRETGKLTDEAYGYGALVGATEGTTEGLFNLIGLGSGAAVKSISKAIGKETAEAFAKQGILKTLGESFVGEAMEEGFSEWITPYWQRATYDPKAKNATADEILYASLVGGLSGVAMGGSGYVYDNVKSFAKGNKLAISGGDAQVLATAGDFASFEELNQTGHELFLDIANKRKALLESLSKTNGKAVTIQQKRDLGALERANIAGSINLFVATRAQNIVNNAPLIAERLTAFGYKTADGKPIRFTAEEITAGYDPKKPSSIYKALQTNSKLRELAVADATGRLMMDTNQFKKNALMGEKLASQVDINRFYEQASREELQAVTDALKIESWSELTPEIFNQKITDFINDGGVQRTLEAKERKAAFASLPQEGAQNVPKFVNLGKDGMRRYTDGQLDIAVERNGDKYTLYNYKTDNLSKEMKREDINKFFRDYSNQKEEYLAAERERLEVEQKIRAEFEGIETMLRDNVKEYNTLNAPSQSMIRRLVREGRAKGVSDSDLVMYAKVSAHSGIDIQFDKEANYRGVKKDGSADYADGFYEAAKNRIVVNPEGKRTAERLLIHELDHAIRKYFDSEGKPATRIYLDAIEGVDQATRDRITEAYKKTAKPGEAAATIMDETNAYYAEQVLGNKYTLEKLIEAEPSLKDKILSFFKGAEADYADVPKLSGAAKKYYRTYKKLFDEFSARNAQSNANEKTLTSMNQENMQISDRQYAANANNQTKIYDYKKPFSDQVDDYKNGKIPKGDTLLIGGTPKVLKDIGLNALPMTINQTHVDYAINGTKNIDHSIGDALLKQLPTALKNPVAIITSRTANTTSLVEIISIQHNGNQVNVPIYIDGLGRQNGVRIDSNAVTSVYSRKNAITSLLTDAINDEAAGKIGIYYWDKKKALALLSGGKVTMPNLPNTLSDGSIHSILENGSPVKPKLKNITESQQFKRWFGKSKAVNADGTPMVLYHQTAEDFTVFNPNHKGAGTNDSETPFGIFMKPDDADIGLKGKKQMALYARITNPLEVNSRYDLRKTLEKLSPEYAKLIAEEDNLATEYKKKIEKASQDQLDYAKKYREEHPNAKRSDIYNDSKFKELLNLEEALIEEWTQKGDEIAIKAKKEITKTLKEKNYDGVHIKNDEGSWGRRVETYIALEPNQVKSATDNIGTFSKYENDINYALDIDSEGENISGAEVMGWLNKKPEGDEFNSPTISTVGKERVTYQEKFGSKEWRKTKTESAYIHAVDEMYGIQSYLEKVGKVKNAKAIIQNVRSTPHQAQSMIGSVQYNVFEADKKTAKKMGEGLNEIFRPIEKMGEKAANDFDDYLLHHLNVDKYDVIEKTQKADKDAAESLRKVREEINNLEDHRNELEKRIFKLGNSTAEQNIKEGLKKSLDRIDKSISDSRADEIALLGEAPGYAEEELKRVRNEIAELLSEKDRAKAEIFTLGNTEADMKRKSELKERNSHIESKLKRLEESAAAMEEIAKAYKIAIKPVFNLDGATISKQESLKLIREYESKYPEFKKTAQKVWSFNKNLNTMRVSAGLLSERIANRLAVMYPHYVPSFKAKINNNAQGEGGVSVTSTVKKAKGYNNNIMSIKESMASQVSQVIRNGNVNMLANKVYDTAVKSGDSKYVDIKLPETDGADISTEGIERPKPHVLTFFKDGKEMKIDISEEIYQGFKGVGEQSAPQSNVFAKVTNWISDKYKKLVTSYSPAFMIRNAIRDMQDAGLNSKHPLLFARNISRAWVELVNNSENWQTYRAYGGFSSKVFETEGVTGDVGTRGFKILGIEDRIKSADKLSIKDIKYLKSILTGVENINTVVEQIPRFAEYLASLEAGETIEQAIYNSAEVTTNFGRRGATTKQLNATIIPFLNPAVQGFDKIFRNVTDAAKAGDGKAVTKAFATLIGKAVVIGILPMLFNSLMYDDDEDYEDLREEDKENNYLIKLPNGTFLKLPRGRVASVVGGLYNRTAKMAKGEDADWLGYLDNVKSQVTPVENLTRTVFSPFMDVAMNRTWYGTEIEGQQFENVRPEDRYDESTSSIAIAIGKTFHYSPKKIHYLIDQYSGVIGDFLLPATSKKAEKDFFSGNFTIDAATSNKLSTNFYKIYDEAQYSKTDGSVKSQYQVKYLNKVKSAVSEMYKEINAIQNSNLTTYEKLQQVRVLRVMINEAYKNAIADYNQINAAIDATANMGFDDSDSGQANIRYAEIIRQVYGAERALSEYNGTVYSNMTVLNTAGISYETLYDYYFGTKNIESDVDSNGNTISGSKRAKVVKAIGALGVSVEERLLLICASGYALGDGDVRGLSAEGAKTRLLRYILKLRGLSADERAEIAVMCGFEVKNGRIINNFSKKLNKISKK